MASGGLWWKCTLAALLLSVVYTDFRRREITIWQLLLLLAGSVGLAWTHFEPILNTVSVNILFLLLQLTAVWLWFALKNRKWSGELNQYIGLGDGLFLLAVAPALAPRAFIMYYTSGVVVTLIFVLILKTLRPESIATIPLAGCLAAWLILWLFLE